MRLAASADGVGAHSCTGDGTLFIDAALVRSSMAAIYLGSLRIGGGTTVGVSRRPLRSNRSTRPSGCTTQ